MSDQQLSLWGSVRHIVDEFRAFRIDCTERGIPVPERVEEAWDKFEYVMQCAAQEVW
jgi:hypothetical protein